MAGDPHALSNETGSGWEAALSARGRAASWTPWWQGELPPPPVEPIMLTGGIPDPDSLPIDELIACNERVLRREGTFALAYGGPQGYPGLAEWLAKRVNAREGLGLGPQNFVITCGAAGGLENLCATFLDPGDVAIVERPTFPGSLRTIKSCLPEVVGVDVDEHGLVPDQLEEAIARAEAAGKRPKLLYTIANFHNPAGATLSMERRERVVELCRAHGVLIIQDDAYGAISFGPEPHPTLFSLAGGSGAVLLGTFSKTLATGLRVGWVMGEQPVIDAVTRMRFDMGVSPWTSRVIAEFCESGLFDEHVERVIEIYRRKRDAMLAALDERCAGFARWSAPEGGFFLWLELAEGIDPERLRYTANEEAVGIVGGSAFFEDGSGAERVRLCYSNVAERDIPEAIMRFGRALERAARA
ncbi:MAG: PLP-dependent aminotransferase family protein [Dehalococcoidia bacterium]|nr:MAG: PLP-dependent aminotransferase family protein [Dehalococcoidia bacterium]